MTVLSVILSIIALMAIMYLWTKGNSIIVGLYDEIEKHLTRIIKIENDHKHLKNSFEANRQWMVRLENKRLPTGWERHVNKQVKEYLNRMKRIKD
ncbi:MAG: hypothetical protein KBA11_05950 [Sedimentibacter sp.]|nr:hypothetical protein [Sedimentibacter sp.]